MFKNIFIRLREHWRLFFDRYIDRTVEIHPSVCELMDIKPVAPDDFQFRGAGINVKKITFTLDRPLPQKPSEVVFQFYRHRRYEKRWLFFPRYQYYINNLVYEQVKRVEENTDTYELDFLGPCDLNWFPETGFNIAFRYKVTE